MRNLLTRLSASAKAMADKLFIRSRQRRDRTNNPPAIALATAGRKHMTQLYQIYKCSICGNVVEVLTAGGGELICCGKPMDLLDEKAQDPVQQAQGVPEGTEKHLPVIEEMPANVCQGKDGFTIKVGDVPHPMDEDHYIEWIEIITADGKRGKRFLKPGDKPEVEFYTRKDVIGARAYCNVHGLWKK